MSAPAKCPTCRRGVTKEADELSPKLYPFCSERCHLIDLGRWLGEEYKIATDEAPANSTDEE